MSALGVLTSAEGEVGRLTTRLVEMLGRPGEEAQHLAQELQVRFRRNRELLERRVEESVRAVTERMGLPLASEIAALERRMAEASARLDAAAARRRARRSDHDEGAGAA